MATIERIVRNCGSTKLLDVTAWDLVTTLRAHEDRQPSWQYIKDGRLFSHELSNPSLGQTDQVG